MPSMNFATATISVTPVNAGAFPPISIKADTFLNEEEILGEAQAKNPRSELHSGDDGLTAQWIDNFAISGQRDIMIFDNDLSDKLQSIAFANPQPEFNLAFTYQRDDGDSTKIRTHYHQNCKFLNHPVRAMSRTVAGLKFTFGYNRLTPEDSSGVLVS